VKPFGVKVNVNYQTVFKRVKTVAGNLIYFLSSLVDSSLPILATLLEPARETAELTFFQRIVRPA